MIFELNLRIDRKGIFLSFTEGDLARVAFVAPIEKLDKLVGSEKGLCPLVEFVFVAL